MTFTPEKRGGEFEIDYRLRHVKALARQEHAIMDHFKATGHIIKWDHFEILASGKTDYHCTIKETET